MTVVADGKGREARTGFRVLEKLRGATLVEALLFTGRTHQIRVHFQHLGFPILGDATYGAKQNQRFKEMTNFAVARQMLHAHHLGLIHPRTGQPQGFDAPYPTDFVEALNRLKSPLTQRI